MFANKFKDDENLKEDNSKWIQRGYGSTMKVLVEWVSLISFERYQKKRFYATN